MSKKQKKSVIKKFVNATLITIALVMFVVSSLTSMAVFAILN